MRDGTRITLHSFEGTMTAPLPVTGGIAASQQAGCKCRGTRPHYPACELQVFLEKTFTDAVSNSHAARKAASRSSSALRTEYMRSIPCSRQYSANAFTRRVPTPWRCASGGDCQGDDAGPWRQTIARRLLLRHQESDQVAILLRHKASPWRMRKHIEFANREESLEVSGPCLGPVRTKNALVQFADHVRVRLSELTDFQERPP